MEKSLGQILHETQHGTDVQWNLCTREYRAKQEMKALEFALIVDPYYLMRKAQDEGKTIQVLFQGTLWNNASSPCLFSLRPDHYRVKPDWKLPDPPEGHEWHRTDWTEYMLPPPYRPLLVGETGSYESSADDGETWQSGQNPEIPTTSGLNGYYRTDRPLPKPKKRVDLEMSDIPDNATIISGDYRFNIAGISKDSIRFGGEWRTYKSLARSYKIDRHDGLGAVPCWKEVEAE